MIYMFIGLVSYLILLSEQKIPDDAAPNNEVIVNSDDDDLNQAFLLIDMLKSEYLKLLRDNPGLAANGTAVVEQSTCAATTGLEYQTSSLTRKESTRTLVSISHKEYKEPASTTGESAPSIASPPWDSKVGHAVPLYPWRSWPHTGTASTHGFPTTQSYNMPRPSRQRPLNRRLGGHWRRFFPDYYFYNVHPRRFYQDPRPLKKRQTTLASANTTIAVHTTAIFPEGHRRITKTSKSVPSTPTSSKARTFSTTNPVRTTKHRPISTTTQRTTKRHTFHKKTSKQFKATSVTLTTSNRNPLEVEVASELLKEFKQINITLKAKPRKISADSASIY